MVGGETAFSDVRHIFLASRAGEEVHVSFGADRGWAVGEAARTPPPPGPGEMLSLSL